jgi:hypothetical protein
MVGIELQAADKGQTIISLTASQLTARTRHAAHRLIQPDTIAQPPCAPTTVRCASATFCLKDLPIRHSNGFFLTQAYQFDHCPLK